MNTTHKVSIIVGIITALGVIIASIIGLLGNSKQSSTVNSTTVNSTSNGPNTTIINSRGIKVDN